MPQGKNDDPVIKPHLIRRMKDRDRVVNFGVREGALDHLEDEVEKRRKPSNMAESISDSAMNAVSNAGKSYMSGSLERVLKKLNGGD